MTATIRVRVNPADSDEYVIYADAEDEPQPWLIQTVGGRYHGWEYHGQVADWPEFELRLPWLGGRADPDLERATSAGTKVRRRIGRNSPTGTPLRGYEGLAVVCDEA